MGVLHRESPVGFFILKASFAPERWGFRGGPAEDLNGILVSFPGLPVRAMVCTDWSLLGGH